MASALKITLYPSFLKGTLAAPSSKSFTQRALAGALLHSGRTRIQHPGLSDDEQAALKIIKTLGAQVIQNVPENIIIESTGKVQPAASVFCGESGLACRLFTPIAALGGKEIKIEGSGSLLKRPMHDFREILPQLGLELRGFNGFLPFSVSGILTPRNLKINAGSGSQFLTGILFALAFSAKQNRCIEVESLKSRPYTDMTLQVLEQFGKKIVHKQYSRFYINPEHFLNPEEVTIQVEGDWSSAAFWLTAGAINGDVTVKNLQLHSVQADRRILEVLKQAGVVVKVQHNEVQVKKSTIRSFEFDATDSPDLFPVLAILAASAEGISRISGLHRLKHKESDREKSIREMLSALGVSYSSEDDHLVVSGRKTFNGGLIKGFSDHRIVMAAAVSSLYAEGAITISDAEAVQKSYPDFFRDWERLTRR